MFHQLPAAICIIYFGIDLLGVFGSLRPILANTAENLGWYLLSMLSSPVTPRADVVMVDPDRESAEAFNLPSTPRNWPQLVHARLLKRPASRHATVIEFDVTFHIVGLTHERKKNEKSLGDCWDTVLPFAPCILWITSGCRSR